VTVGIFEIETTPIVVMVDLARLRLGGIGPIGKRSCPNPTKNFVELCFGDEEGIMLWRNLTVDIHEIQLHDFLTLVVTAALIVLAAAVHSPFAESLSPVVTSAGAY
jgi:hypothetical protein